MRRARWVSAHRLVRPERLELPTCWFEARRSIRLSYGRTVLAAGTPECSIARRCSPGYFPAFFAGAGGVAGMSVINVSSTAFKLPSACFLSDILIG